MAGNEGLQSELEKLCECVICCDRVTNPRTLPCDHSFCKDCLEELVLFKQRGNVPYVQCPNRCGEQCLPPGSTISKMKASLYLKQLLDLLGKTSPVESPYPFDPCCNTANCTRPLKVYCVTCKQFYCQECCKQNVKCKIEKHETKPIFFSKRRNTIEPFCTKHDSSAIYCCQTCSVNYLCKYCKQYSHSDHRVVELSLSDVYKPYKTQQKTLQRYNELFDDLNSVISRIWQHVEITESNFTRYLEKRKMELTLQFLDQLIAAEHSIKQQYQSKVQCFSEDIFDRKQKFENLISKNNKCQRLLEDLETRTLAELLFDNRLSETDAVVKENQTTYKTYSHLDEFRIFVSPNKELDLERPFGHVNFSKDVLKDEEVVKRLQVLIPPSDSKKEKEELTREKNLGILKEKLEQLFSKEVLSWPTFATKENTAQKQHEEEEQQKQQQGEPKKCELVTPRSPPEEIKEGRKKRSVSESHVEESPTNQHKEVPVRKYSEGHLPNDNDKTKFKEKLKCIYNRDTPPDVPERAPFRIPEHPPPTVFIRKMSTVEKYAPPEQCQLGVLHEEVWNRVHHEMSTKTLEANNREASSSSGTYTITKEDSPTTSEEETTPTSPYFPGQQDSLSLRKNQLKQKRRPPVLPKPERIKPSGKQANLSDANSPV